MLDPRGQPVRVILICSTPGQREVVGRPHTTGAGKKTDARVHRVDEPGPTETRTWGSYEKVTVIRRATEEGKR